MSSDSTMAVIGTIVSGLLIVAVLATFSGTIMWAAWDSIHTVFPTAHDSLQIPKEIEWWTAVKFTFLCGTIWKFSSSNTNKNS